MGNGCAFSFGEWLATITRGAVWSTHRAARPLLTLTFFTKGRSASAGARRSTLTCRGHTLRWQLPSRRRGPTRGSASGWRIACVIPKRFQRLLEAWHYILNHVSNSTDVRSLLLLPQKRCGALTTAFCMIASLRRSSGALGALPRPRTEEGAFWRIAWAVPTRVSMIMGALAIKIARAGVGMLFRMPPKRGEGAKAARSLHVTVAVTSLSRPLAISRTSFSALSRTGTGAILRGRTRTLTAPLPSPLSLRRGRAGRASVGGARRIHTLLSPTGWEKTLELGPGMGEQAGGSFSWPPSPPEAGGGTGEAATTSSLI